MKKPDEKIIPLRIEADLSEQIQTAADLTGLSKQDIMRLCMRIGLVDLTSVKHDLPGVIKQLADDKGASFAQFAKQKQGATAPTPPQPPPVPKEKPTSKKNRFEVKELIVPDRSTTLLNEGATDAQREIESLQRRLDELTKETGSKTR